MLTCRELTELVDDYIDGRLGLWERAKFQMHVGMCDACRQYLAQLRATREAVTRLPEPEMPEAVRDEMLERFRSWKRTAPEREPGPAGATGPGA